MPNQFAKTLLAILFATNALLGEELDFGSRSPEFRAMDLRGNPISLPEGRTSVFEFGGTSCVPCIKFIPEMNALQERYPDVVFVSVFCERLDAVKMFAKGPGKSMRVRVAVDDSGRVRKDWLEAAGLEGIPQVFIVDGSGRLAWFGNPHADTLSNILRGVVDGTYDGRLERMRMQLQRRVEQEDQKQLEWVEKVNSVARLAYSCESPAESIALIDKALPEFAGSPERIRLSIMKLEFYQSVPKSRREAFQHALTLAVEAVKERNPFSYISACESMLSHCEFALAENRDSRLVDLALAVLLHESAPTNHVTLGSDEAIDYQAKRLAAIANARRLRGEHSVAMDELKKAIRMLRRRNLKDKPKWWLSEQEQTLSQLESRLSDWKKEAQSKVDE